MRPLDQQVIVITGASSGIGRCTAIEVAKRGAKTVLAARGVEALETARQEIEAAGGEALVVPTDVADYGQVEALGQRAVERFGRIDTWFNNAGVAVIAEFTQTTPAEFRQIVDINLMGEVYGTMVALRLMSEQGGTIINMASVEGERSLPLHAAYAAAKHGVQGFSEALRVELEHNKTPVRVTVIKPASIDTPFFQHARTKLGVQPRPVPPVYDPQLVAEAVLRAAVEPTRDLTVGGFGAMLGTTEKLSPRLLDLQMKLLGYPTQETDEPKAETAPDNLFAPSPGPGTIRGGWNGRRASLYTTLQLRPGLRRAAMSGAALLGFAFARARTRDNGRR